MTKYLTSDDENDSDSFLEQRFLEKFRTITNPLEIVGESYFASNTPIDLFIKLVINQYNIKWPTSDGLYKRCTHIFRDHF